MFSKLIGPSPLGLEVNPTPVSALADFMLNGTASGKMCNAKRPSVLEQCSSIFSISSLGMKTLLRIVLQVKDPNSGALRQHLPRERASPQPTQDPLGRHAEHAVQNPHRPHGRQQRRPWRILTQRRQPSLPGRTQRRRVRSTTWRRPVQPGLVTNSILFC